MHILFLYSTKRNREQAAISFLSGVLDRSDWCFWIIQDLHLQTARMNNWSVPVGRNEVVYELTLLLCA